MASCRVSLHISGMSCVACSSGIEHALHRKNGIITATVNFVSNSALVEFDSDHISLENIIHLIGKLGYAAALESWIQGDGGLNNLDSNIKQDDKIKKSYSSKFFLENRFFKISSISFFQNFYLTLKTKVLLSLFLTAVVVFLSMGEMLGSMVFGPSFHSMFAHFIHPNVNHILQLVLTLCVMHLGRDFFIRGFFSISRMKPNMDSLIALGSTASFIFSVYELFVFILYGIHVHLYFESVCVILSFVLLGKSLENYAKNKTSSNLNSIDTFYRNKTLRLDPLSGEYVEIDFLNVMAGDKIKVLLGHLIPADGIVVEGVSSVDESMISGESLPVKKSEGMRVVSGSLNLSHPLIIQAQKSCSFSTMSEIFNLAKLAQTSRANISRFADVISGYFVPIVIFLALLSGCFWWFMEDFSRGLNVFVSVLVVSCPCALGLATPMAILISTLRSLENGILFKNSKSLEAAHKMDMVVFDKTGTLTTGDLKLESILALDNLPQERILHLARSLESSSEHVIARCILQASRDFKSLEVVEVDVVPGSGVLGKIESIKYGIGSLDLFCLSKQDLNKTQECMSKYGNSMIVWLAREFTDVNSSEKSKHKLLGALILGDCVKPQAKDTVSFLHKLGVQTLILSGDSEDRVSSVARLCGIGSFKHSLKPKDKLEAIQDLKDRGKRVMMVGDGINDAPALSLSDVGVAMGLGTDLSKEKADIVVLNNKISAIRNIFELSRVTLKNIQANLFWAFFYNIIAIILAMGFLRSFGLSFNPMVAAISMSLSSLFVVLSAQRLYLFKFKKE